jgi:hypothetical protein
LEKYNFLKNSIESKARIAAQGAGISGADLIRVNILQACGPTFSC